MEVSMIAEAQSRLDNVQAVPLVPWVGGKRRLAPHILPLLPAHTCYVEPFAGAAGLFFSKPPSKVEVLNDVNGDLVCLYRVVQHHLDEFTRQFRWALNSRQMYAWLQESRPSTLTDIQRAARFFYLQKLAFGGKVDGQTYGTSTTAPTRLNLLRLEEDLSAAHLRLHQVNIENLDWHAFTRNVAELLRLPRKGVLAAGADADLLVLDEQSRICDVMLGGRWQVREGQSVARGPLDSSPPPFDPGNGNN